MRKRTLQIDTPAQDSFTISISDLMSGLLAVFILVLSYFILNFSQATAQLTQNDVTRAELLRFMQRELEREGIKVSVDEQHGILRISEGVLFDVGLADVKPQGQIVIKKLGSVLEIALEKEQFKGRVETIFIEGHTDNIPINNGIFPSNWELSTKRAINTWLTMSSANPRLPWFPNDKGELIFSVSGYADTRPIAENSTEAGRRDNRRIDIRFSMTPPTEEDMSIVKFVRKELTE
ncbi:MAG: OmpA family protein [Selenomonadaceae bacterium]|nr:OmpA family protein [Selenomonadaceae bacterium]